MKTKIVRTLAMTVAAISLLSVSALAKDYNTSAESGTANRILMGTEGEGPATILRGGYDRITDSNQPICPNTIRVTYKYDNTEKKIPDFKVRTSSWGKNTSHYYSVEKIGVYEYWKVTYTHADTLRINRDITLEPTDPTLTIVPTAKTLTYNSQAQSLVNAGTATNGTVQYKLDNGSWSTAIPKATNAGTYTVYCNAKGNKNSTSATKNVTVTINKAASTYTTAPAAKTLTWDGAAQALVSAGTATGGTVQYKLGNGEWSTTVPTATDADTYTVYYKVVGDANHNDIAAKSVTVTISKADASYTTEPAAKTLTWTGEAQELVSAGAATGGTVQYKLGDGEWSTAIPTATAVGTYTVSYKVVGDANHNDIAENIVTATIEAKAATAVYKNVGDISGAQYDGEASAWSVTVTPGSTAITSIDVKVNDQKTSKEGAWTTPTLSGGPITFGVAIDAAADKIDSIKAVVNSSDIETTLID